MGRAKRVDGGIGNKLRYSTRGFAFGFIHPGGTGPARHNLPYLINIGDLTKAKWIIAFSKENGFVGKE